MQDAGGSRNLDDITVRGDKVHSSKRTRRSHSCPITRAVPVLLLAVMTSSAAAQDPGPARDAIVIPRLAGPVRLDGPSDEPAWQNIKPLPARGHAPSFGAEPSERTEFLVAHDGAYLYVAGRLYDSDAAAIRATSLRRDDGSFSNDWFGINLDTFRDRETVLAFATNPAGVRTDIVYGSYGQTGADFTWNAVWDAAVVRTPEGWFAELRIPLSSLRFQEQDGAVVMGMTLWRRIARRNEVITFPAISPQWGWTSPFKASQTATVVLEGVGAPNPVQLTPYVLAGGGSAARRIGEAGLDVKYGLSPHFTLDITANPDFAQVETDEARVQLGRASIFLPERRLFFQERADVFTFAIGRQDRLFHSRRIGLSGSTPVPLLGGARLVGRTRGWDVGALAMRSAPDTGVAENTGVFRVRRQLQRDGSYLGAMATVVAGAHAACAVGVDGRFRLRGQDYLAFQLAQTSDSAGRGADRTLARVFLERRGRDGFTYTADVAHSGPAFRPPVGFLSRRDHVKAGAQMAWGWRPAGSSLLFHDIALVHLAFWTAPGGALESRRLSLIWRGEARSGHEVQLTLRNDEEVVAVPLPLSGGLHVPAGDYSFPSAALALRTPAGSAQRVSLEVDGGGFHHGRQLTLRATPVWNVSRHLEIGGMAQLSRVELYDPAQRLTAAVARLRVEAMLDSRISAAALAQYSSVQDDVGLNLRLRYNPREGDDLFLVWNAGISTAAAGELASSSRVERQALLLKYSRTIRNFTDSRTAT